MDTQLFLTGLFILCVLGLLVAVVSNLIFMLRARAQDTPAQLRFLTASIMNTLTLPQ